MHGGELSDAHVADPEARGRLVAGPCYAGVAKYSVRTVARVPGELVFV